MGNVYEFRKYTKPLKASRFNTYLRKIDYNTHKVIKDEEMDDQINARTGKIRYNKKTDKNRVYLDITEGVDLKVLHYITSMPEYLLLTIEGYDEKDRKCSEINLMCKVYDCEFILDNSSSSIATHQLTLLVKQKIDNETIEYIEKDGES